MKPKRGAVFLGETLSRGRGGPRLFLGTSDGNYLKGALRSGPRAGATMEIRIGRRTGGQEVVLVPPAGCLSCDSIQWFQGS